MKHRRGIDLVDEGDTGYTVGDGSARPDRTVTENGYRVEVWSDEPEADGELVEVISRATDFSVSCAALKAAIRQRPGKVLVHINGRYRMSAERAPDPPLPERLRPPVNNGRPTPVRRRWTSPWVSSSSGTSSAGDVPAVATRG
ncbi:hypothetical protein CN128_07500 [Sinorhizobium meliloti]|uniref:hypothetical protein n=1 Tax=Rhizobium meliloti TaxID=382 RepID=UPI000FDC8AA5|nr:hypothetical protein [Sinorhizobium meliloti]RVM58885.1 hypothetical protein CN128_07500 [Sinorhizobium meliloti]